MKRKPEPEMDLSGLLDQAEEGYMIPCRKEELDEDWDGEVDDREVDLFAKSSCGDTLMHVAVGRGRIDEVRYLIAQGLDVNARGDFLATPLSLAASFGNLGMIGLLLKAGADAGIPDHRGTLPQELLFLRISGEPEEYLEALLEGWNSLGEMRDRIWRERRKTLNSEL